MKKLTVLVLLLFSLTISCKKFISQKTKINGYVTNLCNDSLVGGVTVELSKKSKNGVFYSEEEVVTDEDGNFNFEFKAAEDEDYKVSIKYYGVKDLAIEDSDFPLVKNSNAVVIGKDNFINLYIAETLGITITASRLETTPDYLDSIKIRCFHQSTKLQKSNFIVPWKTCIPQFDYDYFFYGGFIFAGKNIFEHIHYKDGVETHFVDTVYAMVNDPYFNFHFNINY